MQKYLHLLQIVETEKTVAKQLRQQIEDGEIEIERLKSEVRYLMCNNMVMQWYFGTSQKKLVSDFVCKLVLTNSHSPDNSHMTGTNQRAKAIMCFLRGT